MTAERAIEILKANRALSEWEIGVTMPAEAEMERDEFIEACTLAIEALEYRLKYETVTIACPHGAVITLNKLGSEGATIKW